jgi:hypothetical protein
MTHGENSQRTAIVTSISSAIGLSAVSVPTLLLYFQCGVAYAPQGQLLVGGDTRPYGTPFYYLIANF